MPPSNQNQGISNQSQEQEQRLIVQTQKINDPANEEDLDDCDIDEYICSPSPTQLMKQQH